MAPVAPPSSAPLKICIGSTCFDKDGKKGSSTRVFMKAKSDAIFFWRTGWTGTVGKR